MKHHPPDCDPLAQTIRTLALLAEEVEKADPAPGARDDQGYPDTVCYKAVNAMLRNEFLEEHRKVEEQSTPIPDLKARFERVEQFLNAKTGGGR